MSQNIANQKRLLTFYSNKLDHIVSRLREEQLEEALWDSSSVSDLKDLIRRIEEGSAAIDSVFSRVEQQLSDYALTVDSLEPKSDKEAKDYDEYAVKTELVLSAAFDLNILLQARLRSLMSQTASIQSIAEPVDPQMSNRLAQPKQLDLPPLPIPSFGGNRWEWENFWELFDNNIHSQNLPEMVKFNYLINALKGPAREAIKRFQVVSGNYQKAIQFLINKYNNKELLVNQLIERLDKCVLKSPSIKDQRSLLEEIQVITTQLATKGENINSSWIIKKILTKFPARVMRIVITKRQGMASQDSFTIENLIQFLDEFLSTEEMCDAYMGEQPRNQLASHETKRGKISVARKCMYCHAEHSSFACTVHATPQARSLYLRQKNLCLICASSSHKTSECRGRPCFNCKGLHHTSCCFKQHKDYRVDQGNKKTENSVSSTPKSSEKVKANKKSASVNEVIDRNDTPVNNTMMQLTAVLHAKEKCRAFLPTGEITALHPRSKGLIKIDVLLDSGAELSFIDSSLAKELDLPVMREEQMKLHTFGSKETRQASCKLVQMEMWDAEGTMHSLLLYTHDVLTSTFASPSIPESDMEAIRTLNIPIQYLRNNNGNIRPAVLLGCDQMWSFMRSDATPVTLPSGLVLIPTKLGYVTSGKMKSITEKEHQQVLPISRDESNSAETTKQGSSAVIDEKESKKWDNFWSLDTHVNTIVPCDSTISEQEQEMWEKYWTIDAAGTEEFMGPHREARDAIDRMVWDQFNRSIEQREDGYYVRLPWKDNHPPLPDNYAIAYKRLVNVWTTLKHDTKLLEQYHAVFEDQLEKGIVEVVDSNTAITGNPVHYIPHQPVVTPHKTTTKLRIVFDASAHYKECPSLNDVLHRGPVILPSLFGLLLRFRIGAIAIISDVEKAFLQIRLHEADRDATRCLWLQDYEKPPDKGNIRTFRFTRVTFGIKSSPFLLAGTTQYHLNKYGNEPLAQEIKNNIYVDNLILTSDTYQESVTIYRKSKQIFKDLGMNLREFASNDDKVMKTVQENDKTDLLSPKVLGIPWDLREDALLASCSIPDTPTVTKRAITSAIATVYDPLGWFVPLLHKARIFLQQLWKEQYDWDSKIPVDKATEWAQVRSHLQGFQKKIPRFLALKKTRAILITFADASTSGMTACTYLYQLPSKGATLLMAKSKLPSLHVQSTIPKLELNAVTLAMRLSLSVLTQLQRSINIEGIYVYSDSEIVLSWIKKVPQREMGVLVYNRLTEIRKITEHINKQQCFVKYGYVTSEDNPADCGTRGLTSEELQTHFWWTGPGFLQKDQSAWPAQEKLFSAPQDEDGEVINNMPADVSHQLFSTNSPDNNVDSELIQRGHVRTFTKAKRIIAYVLRFIRAAVSKISRNHKNRLILSTIQAATISENPEYITGPEIALAGKILIRHHQRTRVTSSIKSRLQYLNIRPDGEGILLCFGRLGRAQIPSGTKFPIFILQKSLLAEIIIYEIHNKYHPGTNHTMALVRQEYWIPQLRSQVGRIVRRCIQCQKLNNLPYPYPPQDHLPKERVVRASPFSQVGLDYFGPLSIKYSNGEQGKCFGAIITCMVTRLVHLDVVSDQSTVAFLQMLRRFFARRGVPKTIVSDNAPTFLLGETILRNNIQAAQSDPTITKELSNREIEWKHITPYAPWQGGFYERLIKSVKYSLYKTLGGSIVTFEELSTIVVEIESMVNTRPLTYISSDTDATQILRPIDFIQKDIEITFHPSENEEDCEDPLFLPAAELPSIQTRNQAIAALETSCRLTERFWQLWHAEYLTSLREKHLAVMENKKGCKGTPREGQVVLISDAIMPRHTWKIGVIESLVMNNKGTIREAVVRLPTRRLVRRPVNLLVPLELDENEQDSTPQDNTQPSLPLRTDPGEDRSSRYNLRTRKKIDYNEDSNIERHSSPVSSMFFFTTIVQMLVLILLICTRQAMAAEMPKEMSRRAVTCMDKGVQIHLPERYPYEICGEHHCVEVKDPEVNETITFPSDVILHEYRVRWKISLPQSVETFESICPPAPFCPSIDCTFCSTNVFNPECWPVSAILATATILYFVVTGCYVFLYVPLTVGWPVRCLARATWSVLKALGRQAVRILPRRNRGRARRRNLAEILAIVVAISSAVKGCQLVNIFTHQSTVCRTDDTTICELQVSEVFKINSFKNEACLKLSNNTTTLQEIRLRWKSLNLQCEPVTDFFTRDAVHKVVDSKRCAHMGSCVNEKCGSINASSLIPELEKGNYFPGNTACVESCGGLGCDCLSPSSGCLFYRVYMEPVDNEIYEVFHCSRWAESAEVELTHLERANRKSATISTRLVPNIPTRWKSFSFTLTSVGIPPMELLRSRFISNSARTAIWNNNAHLALQCPTHVDAQNLNCSVLDECVCLPAETRVTCKCRDFPLRPWITNVKKQLPINFPSLLLRKHETARVQAQVNNMVTSEIIMSFSGHVTTEIMVDEALCKAEATPLIGCYNCAKGALTQVTCYSSKNNIDAEAICEQVGFTIPCNTTGVTSTLRFSATKAQTVLTCSISCGKIITSFEIAGILKFTASARGLVEQWLRGETIESAGVGFPDLIHIATVFLQWYKTLISAIVGLLIVLAVTYVFLCTYGIDLLKWTILLIPRLVTRTISYIVQTVKKSNKEMGHRHAKQL